MKEIILRNSTYKALVDDSDFDFVNQYKWYLSILEGLKYAVGNRPKLGSVMMHRLIMNCFDRSLEVDHIAKTEDTTLNNQRSNLRIVTRNDNKYNRLKTNSDTATSKFKGVSWDRARQAWKARFVHERKEYFLGRFKSEIDAAKAYNEFAKRHGSPCIIYNDV